MKRILWLFVGLPLWVFGGIAHAQSAGAEALTQRLESLDDKERELIAPLLTRGAVALVELVRDETLPAVLVATYVEAPADLVAGIIGKPQDYPKFMRTLDHVEVLSETPTQSAYKWTWQTGVLSLEGENRMTIVAPPKDRPEFGHRISVKSEQGHLGEGRLMWRVFPAGEKRSLMLLSMRVDMREANFVMKQLKAAAKSVNRSVNLALCYVMALGTKAEAERRVGANNKLPESLPFEAPSLDLPKFKKLLGRADLLLMELSQGGLPKISIVGRTGMQPATLRPVMAEPETFGKALVPGSYTRVTQREGTQKTFEWGISLPLIGTSGVMQMNEDATGLSINATDGALKGGKWRFDTPTLPGGEAVVLGYSQFDITKTTWLVEKIAGLDPYMGHGLAAASQVMMLRALRKRAHDEAQEKNAKGAAAPAAVQSAEAATVAKAAPAEASAPKTAPSEAVPAAKAVPNAAAPAETPKVAP